MHARTQDMSRNPTRCALRIDCPIGRRYIECASPVREIRVIHLDDMVTKSDPGVTCFVGIRADVLCQGFDASAEVGDSVVGAKGLHEMLTPVGDGDFTGAGADAIREEFLCQFHGAAAPQAALPGARVDVSSRMRSVRPLSRGGSMMGTRGKLQA